jgi:hypothetical protein
MKTKELLKWIVFGDHFQINEKHRRLNPLTRAAYIASVRYIRLLARSALTYLGWGFERPLSLGLVGAPSPYSILNLSDRRFTFKMYRIGISVTVGFLIILIY